MSQCNTHDEIPYLINQRRRRKVFFENRRYFTVHDDDGGVRRRPGDFFTGAKRFADIYSSNIVFQTCISTLVQIYFVCDACDDNIIYARKRSAYTSARDLYTCIHILLCHNVTVRRQCIDRHRRHHHRVEA